MAARYLAELGVHEYCWKWLPSEPGAMWDSFIDAASMSILLRNIGFTQDNVLKPLMSLINMVPLAAGELHWGTPEGTYNAVVYLCRVVPTIDLCRLLRREFPIQRVAPQLLEALQHDTVTT